ncbi:hypothetical protein [Sphingomonas dokdonensis]|uniref:Uncharacterized protein n=1 Tax=Sphingomonas dokdonensis TaxID=344880 RepID=A0A245ZKC7_9SPHN|nr:hypothetical protein [Sphingomonas dokdonensis]OWK30193.1 hypothetical protein SPDO_18750 [Sphingomonas dokdonensis]
MIDLHDTIDTIKRHLAEGSNRSLTYAALECRLAIERICYDRLARAHDYISHEEVRSWRPHHVIKLIEEDVDPHVASTYTFSISTQPALEGEDLTKKDYVTVGTQQGFDGARLAKLWNALSNTALHVSLPKSSGVSVTQFGSASAIRAKVEQALGELERIATGTMTSNGFGPGVSFTCECGQLVKRRSDQLSAGKVIHCINPACNESYKVKVEDDRINFDVRAVHVTCMCGEERRFPKAPLEKLRVNEIGRSHCSCGAEIIFCWKLFSAIHNPDAAKSDLG